MSLSLDTKFSDDGIECTHDVMGKIATIKKVDTEWYVYPYLLPAYSHGKNFKSLRAAEYYALALAHEIWEAGGTDGKKPWENSIAVFRSDSKTT